MPDPLVSVLIPMFNAERFILETLQSVNNQSHKNIEIIVVDDGSTDQSASLVNSFQDQRLKLIQQRNAGQAAALNTALKHASGNYIQYLDADDLISINKIGIQIERLTGNQRCIASSEWGRFYEKPEETQWDHEEVWRDLSPLDWLAGSRADGGGMMFPALWLIPRVLINEIGPWREGFDLGHEAEYFTRALLASDRVLFGSEARCHYRSGIAGSVSGRKSESAWSSLFNVTNACETLVRQREDSERIRRGFALSWKRFAHGCYPYHPQLAELALNRAQALHPVHGHPEGGTAFHITSRLLGWRLARRLQVWSGRP